MQSIKIITMHGEGLWVLEKANPTFKFLPWIVWWTLILNIEFVYYSFSADAHDFSYDIDNLKYQPILYCITINSNN